MEMLNRVRRTLFTAEEVDLECDMVRVGRSLSVGYSPPALGRECMSWMFAAGLKCFTFSGG